MAWLPIWALIKQILITGGSIGAFELLTNYISGGDAADLSEIQREAMAMERSEKKIATRRLVAEEERQQR